MSVEYIKSGGLEGVASTPAFSESETCLDDLPTEVLEIVFNKSNPQDVVSAGQTCKRYYALSHANTQRWLDYGIDPRCPPKDRPLAVSRRLRSLAGRFGEGILAAIIASDVAVDIYSKRSVTLLEKIKNGIQQALIYSSTERHDTAGRWFAVAEEYASNLGAIVLCPDTFWMPDLHRLGMNLHIERSQHLYGISEPVGAASSLIEATKCAKKISATLQRPEALGMPFIYEQALTQVATKAQEHNRRGAPAYAKRSYLWGCQLALSVGLTMRSKEDLGLVFDDD